VIGSLQLGMHWFPERAGGLDRVYYELSRALPAAGVAVSGLIAGSGLAAAQSLGAVRAFAPADAPLAARLWGARREFAAAQRLRRPDVVAAHFALYALPVLGALRSPLVVHFQGPWAAEGSVGGRAGLRHAVKSGVERLVYRRAARAIVLSQAFAEVLSHGYGVPRERIEVIPGGVAAGQFAVAASQAAARARLGWPAGRPIVLAVRRLVPRMGLEGLIDAIGILARAVPEALLMIAGRGPLAAPLAARIAALGLCRQVRLLGFVPEAELAYHYRAADLSVVPSVALEGFGLVAAESLAAGTPCLVAPVGGLPEVVAGLSANLVMASAAPEDIAAALGDALLGSLAMPGAAACSAYAAARFDWPIIATRVAGAYRAAMR
jgi:glycosyltransferase involved in cell wall biosynthesis